MGRPVGLASFGNGGVLVVCDDGSAWYMATPHGVWFRQMPVPGVPDPWEQPARPNPSPGASDDAAPTQGAAPRAGSGGWTTQPPFPIPDDIPDDQLPPGVKR